MEIDAKQWATTGLLPKIDQGTKSCSSDPVNKPSHYTSGSIECIDAIQASMSDEAFKGFLKGNFIKYAWRMEKKDNPKQDLEKAKWYLERLISLM